MPSAPSRYGCWTQTASRHSVFGGERRVAAHRRAHPPAPVEVDAPDRAARGVGHVQRPVTAEREAVGDQVLRAQRVRRLAPRLGDRDRPRRQPAHVAPDAARHHVIGQRLDAEDLGRRPVAPDPPHAALRRPAVGDPQRAALVQRHAVGARHAARVQRRRRRGAPVRLEHLDAVGVGDVQPPVGAEREPGRIARRGQVADDRARPPADPEHRAAARAAARRVQVAAPVGGQPLDPDARRRLEDRRPLRVRPQRPRPVAVAERRAPIPPPRPPPRPPTLHEACSVLPSESNPPGRYVSAREWFYALGSHADR